VAGACGLGTLSAAKQAHVWGIGADIDESYIGSFMLTSVVKRLDVAVFDLVRSLKQGALKTGGNAVFDLRNKGVDLGAISPKVPPAYLRQVQRIHAQIVAGKIKVPSVLPQR
jgi:basic membrane protein A